MTRRYMEREPFAMHEQRGWEERAANPGLPDWLRVMSLAYGRHRANGHANFGTGDIAAALYRVRDGGEVMMPSTSTVSRAIRTAVTHGALAEGSTTRCLIVPAHITGGLGRAEDRCQVHEGRRRRASERPLAVA